MPAAAVIDIVSGSEWEGRAEFPPGPQLACALAGQRLDTLSDAELTEVMAAARRQTSWSQALELSAVAELSRRRHLDEHGPASVGHWTSEIHESVTEEVSLALNVTGTAASGLVVLAEQLSGELSVTRAALESGRIDLFRVKVIADAVRGLDHALASAVEAAVIDEAATLTTGKLRRRVKEAVRAADPKAAEERRKAAVRDRRLELFENSCGTGDLAVRDLPAEDAHAIWNRITAVAQAMKADGDQRPIDAVRADLAHALLRGIALPVAAGRLISDPDDGDPDDGDCAPSDAVGSAGAVPARDAERNPGEAEIAAELDRQVSEILARGIDQCLTGLFGQARGAGRLDGLALLIGQAMQAMYGGLAELKNQWCDTTGGTPGKHGHAGYRPPAGMRRLIERRHPRCVFPTCNRQATCCDLDHTIPWHKGGRTCRCNLSPLCRRHHRLKQHPSWKLLQPWPGLLIWITPSGTWHIVSPQ